MKYKQNSKNKSQEHTKFLAYKKALIAIIFGKCNVATTTKIALGATNAAGRQAENLIKFIKQLDSVCFGGDDDSLSNRPYKQVVAVKSMNNYNNNEPYIPHGLKE